MVNLKDINKMKTEIDQRFEQHADGLIHTDELLVALLSIVGKIVLERKVELLDEKREIDHALELFSDINV